MKLEEQVTSLEFSKKLKELGVEQKSLFYWSPGGEIVFQPNVEIQKEAFNLTPPEAWTAQDDDTRIIIAHHTEIIDKKYIGLIPFDEYISAFTVAELGELLPCRWGELLLGEEGNSLIKIYKIKGDDGVVKWEILYSDRGRTPFVKKGEIVPEGIVHQEWDIKEANARAKLLIYLLENKLI